MTDNATAEELRQIVEKLEQLDAEKADVLNEIKEANAEVKSRGFELKVIRKIIAERKRNADDVAEEEAIMGMYKQHLGMV